MNHSYTQNSEKKHLKKTGITRKISLEKIIERYHWLLCKRQSVNVSDRQNTFPPSFTATLPVGSTSQASRDGFLHCSIVRRADDRSWVRS